MLLFYMQASIRNKFRTLVFGLFFTYGHSTETSFGNWFGVFVEHVAFLHAEMHQKPFSEIGFGALSHMGIHQKLVSDTVV